MSINNILMDDFTLGEINRLAKRFNFPDKAISDGLNLELAKGGLHTRPGSSIMSADSLPVGEVMAMCQFRSPTTETSYIVAQVKTAFYWSAVGGVSLPQYRESHAAVWDIGNGRMLVFGGRDSPDYFNDLWAYYPSTDTWAELAPTGGPPAERATAIAIYVPATEKMYVFGGLSAGASSYYYDTWVLDCQTDTWSELSTTGTPPGSPSTHRAAFYRPTSNEMVIVGIGKAYYSLNLSTFVWTAHIGGSATFPVDYYSPAAAYDSNTDTAIMCGGYHGDDIKSKNTWILNLTTGEWTQKTDMPLVLEEHRAICCSGNVVITGQTVPLKYTVATDTWTELPDLATSPAARISHSMVQTDDGRIILFGGYAGSASLADAWILFGVCGSPVSLYACPDHLPTTTGGFTQIADLGTNAGVCTFQALLDRLIITEGIANVPLVWGGYMANDASDWIHPLHVLASQDGQRYYDVSPQVCDKDPDTVAQVGDLHPWGHIDICTDMPTVEGFYFDMQTPNTGSGGNTANTFHAPMVIAAAADVTRQDLKATIANWVQSAGATGHFTTGGGTTVSIGAGQTNPDVIPGMLVEFAAAELQILSVTGDGTGAGAVTLSATQTSAAITAIYGLQIGTNPPGLTVNYETGGMTSAFIKTLNSIAAQAMAGFSIRQVVTLSSGGDHIRLTLKSFAALVQYQNLGFQVTHVSIVAQDTGANGTTTPTEITFNGGEHSCAIATHNTELVSDIVPYTSAAGNYLVTLDLAWQTTLFMSVPSRAGFLGVASTGTAYYKEAGFGNAEESWNQQTVTGFSDMTGTFGVDKVEVSTLNAVPNNTYVATSATPIQLSSGIWEGLVSVTPTQVQPGTSVVWWAFSLDNFVTIQVFLAGAHRLIVKNNSGTWQYNDSATTTPSWHNSTVNSMDGALRQAFPSSHNQMSATALAAMTQTDWQSTGGFIPHITATFDFAVAMAADSANVPTVELLDVLYANAGQSVIQVFKNGAFVDVAGWTDDTISGGVRLGKTGIIGGTAETADYHVLDGVPGYWWRLLTEGTSPTCAITEIKYKAPCQPLANISSGQPDIASGVIFVDGTTGATIDCTTNLSDGNYSVVGCVALPMKVGDYLYVGSDAQFNEIELTPYGDPTDTTFTNNQASSVATWEYWNGEAYVVVTVTDGTDIDGKTLAQRGRVSFTLPSDWKRSIPFSAFYSRGHWMRMSVSAPLTATFAMSEARVYAVPFELKKHRLVTGFLNRIVLLDRMDGPDQADISRELEEYGFCGQGFASLRLGGTDAINCAVEAWDSVIIGKATTLHQLSDAGDGTFKIDTIEATRHTPVNSQSIVKAPVSGIDGGDRYGLYFGNRSGMFAMTGLHTDSKWNTSRGKTLSDNFWDTRNFPHLEFGYMHHMQGVYFPPKNWLVMTVPMRWANGDSVQTTNNALIVYDLTMSAWLPPVKYAAFGIASLCLAHHYDANSRGHIGEAGLYGGTYDGRVVRLFDPAETEDLGVPVPWFAKWGYLSYGQTETEKTIRIVRLYGRTDATAGVNLTVTGLLLRGDGDTVEDEQTVTFTRIAGATESGIDFAEPNIKGNVIEYLLEGTEYAVIEGIEVGIAGLRDWPRV